MRTDREQGSAQRALAPEAAPSVLVHRAACVILAPFISLSLKALIYKIIDGTRWNCLRNPCSSDSLWFWATCCERQGRTDGRPLAHLLFVALSSCFSVSSSVPRIFSAVLSFCLAFPLTLYFCFSLVFPFWTSLPHVPLSPCQVLRWKLQKLHIKHHAEILIFWDAEKLCSTELAFPPLLGFGAGPPLPEGLKSGIYTWNPGHVGTSAGWTKAGGKAEKSVPKNLTIGHSNKLCCFWIFWKRESDPMFTGKT